MQDILIIDDDQRVRRALARAFVAEGYSVATAGDGDEALHSLARSETPPKVIIMDLMMPVMDGWRFRRHLLEQPRWANVPLIVFSGAGCEDSGDSLPGVLCIPKPVSLRTLFDSVARLITEGWTSSVS
jgi:CheY-like chemotaxis protein